MLPLHVSSEVLCVVLDFAYSAAFLFVKYDSRLDGIYGRMEEQARTSRPFLLRQLTPCSCEISHIVLSG